MAKKEVNPDDVFGPRLADLFHEFSKAISKETSASGVRVSCEYVFHLDKEHPLGKGDMKLKTFTTPDGKTERLLDADTMQPRGTRTTHEAVGKVRLSMKKVQKKMGGK